MLSVSEFFYGNVEPLCVVGTAASPATWLNMPMSSQGQQNPVLGFSNHDMTRDHQNFSLSRRNSQSQQKVSQFRGNVGLGDQTPQQGYRASSQQYGTSDPGQLDNQRRGPLYNRGVDGVDGVDGGEEQQSRFSGGRQKEDVGGYHQPMQLGRPPVQNGGSDDHGQNSNMRNSRTQETSLSNGHQQSSDRQMQYLGSDENKSPESWAKQKPRSLNIYNKENKNLRKSEDQGQGSYKQPQNQRTWPRGSSSADDGGSMNRQENYVRGDEQGYDQVDSQKISHKKQQANLNGSQTASAIQNSNVHPRDSPSSQQVYHQNAEQKSSPWLVNQSHDHLQEVSNYNPGGSEHNRERGRSSSQAAHQKGNLDGGPNVYREVDGFQGSSDTSRREGMKYDVPQNQSDQSTNGTKKSSYDLTSNEEHHDQKKNWPRHIPNGSEHDFRHPQSHEFKREGYSNKLQYVRLWVDMCCESCEDRVSGTLSKLEGVKYVDANYQSKRVLVHATTAPADVLKACRNLHKKACLWSEDFHGRI
ncbi:hypothetical protein Mp_4g12750 [Marchantia polymorpha subsp. ruderalis]|uniref:HMA domain-containing protein n=2 Tax=Marchantia polymorpha TaxID=3197 RepID=A0A176VLQ1_MARPO|nr:hypothetical protein AXG93_138s1010 [Marchantia polymorpha subsp. ruderalis]PTQ29572.1 hypothetical protein MARPO_0138s0012 [Marchantia polymorpha]BBN08586.1 hypothetical protein Mp_4g12750 [Marchantia polymorpha subsp. ruderalis]|eukprot:PTQ29572.1 hypothetical protein MARPO_0138s0012 [Marchantia polymorpha]